jgi:hypothetical protein
MRLLRHSRSPGQQAEEQRPRHPTRRLPYLGCRTPPPRACYGEMGILPYVGGGKGGDHRGAISGHAYRHFAIRWCRASFSHHSPPRVYPHHAREADRPCGACCCVADPSGSLRWPDRVTRVRRAEIAGLIAHGAICLFQPGDHGQQHGRMQRAGLRMSALVLGPWNLQQRRVSVLPGLHVL